MISALLRNALIAILVLCPGVRMARAQDDARAVWQVANWDITVNSIGPDRALNARAIVSLRNVGRASGSSLSLRINAKTEIKSVSIGGSPATYKPVPEARGGAQRISITLPNSVAPNATLSVAVDYRFPVEENTGIAGISPLGTQFLPESIWYPQLNTRFAVRGADTAPFHLTINGALAITSGNEVNANSGSSVFEQRLNALPFFLSGSWDRIDGAGNGKNISAYLLKGASVDERKRADSLIALATNARTFVADLLGPVTD